MKRSIITIEDIKQAVLQLKGEQVKLYVNRGRRKIFKLEGVIDKVYTSVFTVKQEVGANVVHTYSYSDILCGEVKISKLAQQKN